MKCDILDYSNIIGKKWGFVIFEEIALGKFNGFNQILKKSGLTPRILSKKLKEMEASELIIKINRSPDKYELTDKGEDFREITKQIKLFNKKWQGIKSDCLNTSCLECENTWD